MEGMCIKCGMPLIDINEPSGLCTRCKDTIKKKLAERASVKGPTRGQRVRVYIPSLDRSRRRKKK